MKVCVSVADMEERVSGMRIGAEGEMLKGRKGINVSESWRDFSGPGFGETSS
jgi:hypothetical protein